MGLKQIHTIVKRIILTMEDGSTKEIQSEADKDGNGLIDLTKYGTVVGWRMEMKDDFCPSIWSGNYPQ